MRKRQLRDRAQELAGLKPLNEAAAPTDVSFWKRAGRLYKLWFMGGDWVYTRWNVADQSAQGANTTLRVKDFKQAESKMSVDGFAPATKRG